MRGSEAATEAVGAGELGMLLMDRDSFSGCQKCCGIKAEMAAQHGEYTN